MTEPAFPAERLLEHHAFLRALARELVGDAARADDLLQDAYLQALRRPPRDAGALRGWLARVLRNRAINLRREESRRAAREEACARREAGVDGEVEQRIETERRVLAALQRLREPYRSTLWLRWFEGLPPRRIAARTGARVETVHSRLKRGLAELRGELDREFGDRGAWSLALAPWLASRSGAALAWCAGVAGLAALLFVGASTLRAPAGRAAPRTLARARVATQDTRLEEPARPSARARLESADMLAPAPAGAELALATGIACDARTGEPLPELDLGAACAGRTLRARTRADGSFALAAEGELEVRDAGVPLGARRVEGGVAVEVGPTLRLEFAGALPCPPAELVARLDGGPEVPVREGPEPWVRFPPPAALSLLGRAERSRFELCVATRDGRFAARAAVHARPGLHAERVHLALAEQAPEAAASMPLPSAPAACVELRGRLASRRGLALGGLVRARGLDPAGRRHSAAPDASGAFAFAALEAGRWEIVPPLEDGFEWSPARAELDTSAPAAPVFERLDDRPASPVRVRAFDAVSGAALPEFRFALLPDRLHAGKRAALDYQGDPELRAARFGERAYAALPAGTPCFWLVEHEGFLSARGSEDELRPSDGEWLLEVRLEPSRAVHLVVLGEEGDLRRPLAGARLVTSRGKPLAESLDDGRIELELAYDPGRLGIELPGWRVASWEGTPRADCAQSRVVLVRERR